VHCKPDLSVFYVGKGKRARAFNLQPGRRSVVHARTVAKYGAENIGVGFIECSSEAIAFELEKGLIKCFRRANAGLVNMTDGGEGKSGCPNPPEAYARAAKKLTGQKRSEEFKRQVSERMSGRVVSLETRAKLSRIFKERPLSEAFRAQLIGRRGTDNWRARAVIGTHPEHGTYRFDTVTAAAGFVGGSNTKVCRSIKLGHKHKGWTFMYEGSV
jgi:hypothetical protein